MKKRKSLTPSMARKWAEMAHLLFIDAISYSTPMAIEQIAFQGGTNLHLSWGSPRHSEDLDFLLDRELGPRIREVMPRIARRMQHLAKSIDPDLQIGIQDKTRDEAGMLNFRIVLSSPLIVGQVMAKAEFWQVAGDYLEGYETKFVRPAASGDIVSRISQPVPSATLRTAFADKVVALANRPYLKWRDLFDLWWIDGQQKMRSDDMIDRILHNATAYDGVDGMVIAKGLRDFLARDPEEIRKLADPDLKRWLPKSLWDSLNPRGIREMVDHARAIASEVASLLEGRGAAPGRSDPGEEGRDETPSCP